MATERKPIKKKKPPTPKKKTGETKVYEGVECYLTPKQRKFCKNFVVNGGIKAKALREAGYGANYAYSPTFKNNKYIPLYIEQLRKEFIEFGEEGVEDSESYADFIKKSASKLILKRHIDVINFRFNRAAKWNKEGLEIFDSETLSPEDLAAIKEVTIEKTEYGGRNPRTTIKARVVPYDANVSMKEVREMLGIDFKKDQDTTYILDQLKNMLANQKKSGIFPTLPTPETDPSLLKVSEEETVSVSEMTKH